MSEPANSFLLECVQMVCALSFQYTYSFHFTYSSLYNCCYLDIFVNTKMDEGPCQKIHSETLKADFQKSRDLNMFDSQIEREFNARIGEADRVIKVFSARFLCGSKY